MSCKLFAMTDCSRPPAGIAVDVYLVEASALTAMPQTIYEAGVGTNGYTEAAGDRVKFATAFAFTDSTSKWLKITGVVDMGMLDGKSVGEKAFSAFENTLKFFVAGYSPELRGNIDVLQSCGCGWIAAGHFRGDRDYFIIGDKGSPVYPQINLSTGTKPGEKVGCEFMITSSDGKVVRTYPVALGAFTII